MTPARAPTVGSMFSGIGGFDLAAEAKGWETRWLCEIDPFCREVLAHHWPGVPIHGDATQLHFEEVEPVDIICAGFPCQPHSFAGKRGAAEDERDLWPAIVGAVRALRPGVLVLENVAGLLTSEFAVGHLEGRRTVIPSGFFGRVLGDLAALGYDARWDVLSAAECGAPHRRERIWIVAYRDGERRGLGGQPDRAEHAPGRVANGRNAGLGDPDGGRREQCHAIDGRHAVAQSGHLPVGDAVRGRRGGLERRGSGEIVADGRARLHEAVGDADRTGLLQHGRPEPVQPEQRPAERRVREIPRWQDAVHCRGADGTIRLIPEQAAREGPESPLWPVAHGIPGRVAHLRAIGNAVNPAWVLDGPFRFVDALMAAGMVLA